MDEMEKQINTWKKKHPGKLTFREWITNPENDFYCETIFDFAEKPEGWKDMVHRHYMRYLDSEQEEFELKQENIEQESIDEDLTDDSSHVINDIIKETNEGYIIYSHKGKRLSKPYKNKSDAEKRLKEIEMFKHMKDSEFEGYDIVPVKGHYEIYKDGKLISTADNLSEAKEDIRQMVNQKPKLNHYEVEFLRYGEPMIIDYWAKTEEGARRQLIANFGTERLSQIRITKLQDKEIKDMTNKEIVKKWLNQFVVKKDDPQNKLGKDYLRNLRNNEKLPKNVYHKAGTDMSGILHYKNQDYYWYLDKNGQLVVEDYPTIKDTIDKRFICRSYFDEKMTGLEDQVMMNDLDKIKDWVLRKSNQGYATIIIDKKTGEVWPFKEIEDPEELEEIKPWEEDSIHLWIVEWYNPNGIKFRGEFDAEEDAKQFVEEHKNNDNYIQIKLKQEDVKMNDSLKRIEAQYLVKRIKNIFLKYLVKLGYDPEDIDEWVSVRVENFTNDEGDKGVHVRVSNELVGFYNPGESDYYQRTVDDMIKELDKLVDPGYFEPYYEYTWDAYIFGSYINE